MKKLFVLAMLGAVLAMTIVPAHACYYTIGYWKNHPEAWPVDYIEIGGDTYTNEEAIDILKTPPRGDASIILAKQLIAAKLNWEMGARLSYAGGLIENADDFLESIGGIGSNPSGDDRTVCLNYATQLDDANNTPW